MPGAEKLVMLADFTMAMFGVWVPGMVSEAGAVTWVPAGEVPVAVPVLVMLPRSTSAWVVV